MAVLSETIEDVFEFDSIIDFEYIESKILTIYDVFEFDSIITTELIPYGGTVNDISVIDIVTFSENIQTTHNASFLFTDTLTLSDTVKTHAPAVTFTSRLGDEFDIKATDLTIIEHPPSSSKYTITIYCTVIVNGTTDMILDFKKFLDYYHNEPLIVNNNMNIYEVRLDFSDNTRRSMDMFRNDTRIILNFYAIKIN